MIPEITAAPKLVPVATGHSTNGQPYAVTVAPDYGAYQQRLEGAARYRHCEPMSLCENHDQVQGWLEERDWYIGQAQYLRALELDNCPASWAEPYSGGRPLDFDTNW